MARDTSKLVTIPGELHSAATGNIVSASQEIFDYDSNSYQSQLNKQVYNVSAHDSSATAKYTLDEAIAAVPASYHVGGLILTFVSKEGDFEMYQLKSKDWTADTEKWGIIKTAIVKDNPEFVEVHLDGSDKVLYGVHKDGDFYFGGGVPSQVKNYVDEKSAETNKKIDELSRIVDSSIQTVIDEMEADIDRLDASVNSGFAKVDASINALDASVHNLGYYEENPEYAEAHIDASNRLLYGVHKDGDFYFGGGVPKQIQSEIDKLGVYENNPEYVEAHTDASSHLLYGVERDGNFYFGAGVPSQIRDYVNEKGEKIDASILEIETRFYNVNAHDGSIGINYTLEEAIAAVPEEYRNGGLILTFNSNGSNVIYQDSSTNWSENINDWNQYIDKKSLDVIDKRTSEIFNTPTLDDREQIIIATDDNIEVTSISAEKINDDTEGIIITTNDDKQITSIDVEKVNDDSEVLEFNNESNTETYAKIGVIDDKKGLFVNNLYDLNGDPLLQIDSSNDILILAGKKYKMIPYIE